MEGRKSLPPSSDKEKPEKYIGPKDLSIVSFKYATTTPYKSYISPYKLVKYLLSALSIIRNIIHSIINIYSFF